MSPMMGANLSRDGEWVQVIAHEASIPRAKTSGRFFFRKSVEADRSISFINICYY